MPVRKLTQTQPACPVLVNPPRTLGAPVRQFSVPISFHAATVASRLDRRLDAPRLPLTFQESASFLFCFVRKFLLCQGLLQYIHISVGEFSSSSAMSTP